MANVSSNLQTRFLAAAAARNGRSRSRAAKAVATSLALLVLVAAGLHFYGDAVLTRLLKPKLERSFAAHFRGYSLRLGALHYDVWTDRVACDSASLTSSGGELASAGSIAAMDLHWGRLLTRKLRPAQIFSSARLEVRDFSATLANGEYRVSCSRLQLSVPDSVGTAQTLTLQPVASDETFLASSPFRRVRYRLAIGSCVLRGVDFAALLDGQAYRAQSLDLTGAVVETLVDHSKPRRLRSWPMPHEVLAAVAKPLRLDRLAITDGLIKMAALRSEGAKPGVLTFTAVQIHARDIANAAAGGEALALTAEGRLMDAGTLMVQMRLPVAPGTLAFHYSGSLSAMDLTRLDEYMEGSGRVQIRSGRLGEATFDIDVVDGHARGVVRGTYRNLHVVVVSRDTGSRKGVANRVETILANALKVRNDNTPDQAGALRAGRVDYARKPEDSFPQFAWLALRTGLLDVVSLQAGSIP